MTDCLDENQVVDLVEGRLDAASVDRVTQHLDACAACRKLVTSAARDIHVPGGSSSAPPPDGIRRGTCVGRYVVLDRLGVGSMGVVYGAYDPELSRRVALKLLRADLATRAVSAAELRARLVREAQSLARLSHPNVITIYDVGAYESEVFLTMELVEGGTLARWLHAEPRTPEVVLEMFRQAGEGLAAAHAAGIVHRDFKPENVLLGIDGRVRVSDFGLARASGDTARPRASTPEGREAGSNDVPLPATTTRTGALVGTPAYMAPEQWLGRPSDARTDVFAFSVALYEALYGERPFRADTASGLREAALRNEVQPASSSSRIAGSVRRVLLRGLRADPAERYPSMQALLDDLAPPRPRRAWLVVTAIAVAGLASAAFVVRRPAAVCEGAAAEWGDVFDGKHEEALHHALLQTKSPSAEPAFAAVRRTLGQYASEWIAMRTDACRATRVRGGQSEALLDLRMRCLDERRRAATAFVRSVEAGSGADLAVRAVHGASDLARVDDCADTKALAEAEPMPADPAKRARIVALSGSAAEAEAEAVEAGQGLASFAPLLAEARELAWKPLVARLLYDHALRLSRLRRNREAELELQDAGVAAEEAHADATLLDVWIQLLYVVGYQEYRVDEGLLWGRFANAALARLGGDDHRAARLHGYIGAVLLHDENRLEEARANFERSLELAKRADGPRSGGVADALNKLSMALFAMSRPEEALPVQENALAIEQDLYGPEGIDLAVGLGNQGESLLECGRVDEALPMLERSAAMQERLGRNDAAVLGVIARALRGKGEAEEALDVDRRALAMVERNEAPDTYPLSFPDVGVALDLLALGRPGDALPFAERAATLRKAAISTSERGEAKFALARALWGTGDPARARQVAADARTEYQLTAERYGGRYRRARDEIDTWLAERSK